MTDKQKRFADAFLRTGDGDLALKEAGYPKYWTVERALAAEAVRVRLGVAAMADETEVAAFFSAVMRGTPAADEKPPGVKDQLRAAELLGKHFGMFTDREKSGGGEPVEFIGDEALTD